MSASEEQIHTVACSACGAENADDNVNCTTCGVEMESSSIKALVGSVVLGVYRIESVLGQGGMSVVYKAKHRMTEQQVALKILPPELAVHGDLKARFLEEAKALAKLEHPNIVRLYHFGEEQGRFVLAMQFVEGQTFEDLIFKNGKLPWEVAVQITCEILRALDYAHDKGVVHRDIKPSNVLVRSDNSALVMDFGIAKMSGAQSSRLTATGQTMGTVRYMSPEQVRGQSVDARSDIYSLGATLFEALSGDTPFDGTTHFEIMMKHLQEAAPSVRSRGIEVPAGVDAALVRAMAKDPAARWQTAADFLGALSEAAGVPITAAVQSTASQRRSLEEATPLPAPIPTADADKKAKIRAKSAPLTGIATSLEPSLPAGAKRRTWIWITLAALVLGASAAVILVVSHHGETKTTSAPPAGPGWPKNAVLVPGLSVATDKTFAEDRVRVISTANVDPSKIAGDYAQARKRFADFASAKAQVDAHEVTLILAPPSVMCAHELYDQVPENCLTSPPRYKFLHAKDETLYVLDDKNLEVNLVEGAATQLCILTAPLLQEGCTKTVLPSFFAQVEKK